MQQFKFEKSNQESIYRRLLRVVGPGAAAFYQDACRLLVEQPPYRSTVHLVAHLLREVESSIRALLNPADVEPIPCPECGYESKHKANVKAALKELQIDERDPVAKLWLALAGTGGESQFHKLAHRSDLSGPRVVDSTFTDFCAKVDALLGMACLKG